MKKRKRIVLLVIAIIAILVSFIGGQSYAKYMSKITGQGTADIANWKFKVNDKEEQIQTIYLRSKVNNETLTSNKIAPGTEGDFQIKIDATCSEVGINYSIRFENESKKPTNLKFTYDDKVYNSLSDLQQDLIGVINSNDEEKVKILTITWEWKYETGNTDQEKAANDIIDTQEAKIISNYSFDVIISGTQVMPQN